MLKILRLETRFLDRIGCKSQWPLPSERGRKIGHRGQEVNPWRSSTAHLPAAPFPSPKCPSLGPRLQSCYGEGGEGQTPALFQILQPNFSTRRSRGRRKMGTMSNGAAGAAPSWHELSMQRVLWSSEDLQKRVEELGKAISEDFSGESLAVVGVATGAFIFLADLVRKIKVPVVVDIIRVQSYGAKTQSSGIANLLTDIRIQVKDKNVLLVEDIVDTGVTLATLIAHFEAKGVKSVSVCALLDKSARRKVPLKLSAGGKYYRGFECPDEFVVGYGMDYAEEYRSLPYVGVLKPDVYSDAT